MTCKFENSNELLHAFVRNSPDIVYTLDQKGEITFINDTIKCYGYEPGKLVGESIFEIIHPEDKENAVYRINERRTGDRKTKAFAIRLLTNDELLTPAPSKAAFNDRIFLLDAEGMYRLDSETEFIGTQGVARDITDYKRPAKELNSQNEILPHILESLFHPLYIIDANDYTIKLANSAAQFGRLSRSIKCYEATHNRDNPCNGIDHPCPLLILKESKKPVVVEHTHIDQHGNKKVVEIHGYPLFDESGEVSRIIEYSLDITENRENEKVKKQLEEQLFQAQKMESVGRLAGGIAHDFNNILTGIMGYADILKIKSTQAGFDQEVELDEILKLSERASTLTEQLLSFARKKKSKFFPINIDDVLNDSFKVVEKIFEPDTEVEIELKDNAVISGDQNQLMQVFTNLFINARDAMPEGGKLRISTSKITVEDKLPTRFSNLHPGGYVKIEISDTGFGMSAETLDKIFEPFYTTKGDNGTGLGLSMTYGILKNHSGYISVFSKPDSGTAFEIYFPLTKDINSDEEKEQEIIKGGGTILIIDDEEDIRYSMEKLLNFLDYSAITASTAQEGLDILREVRNPELVILDIIIPGSDAFNTFQEIKEINPEQKTLIISGYNRNGIVKKLLNHGANGFIQKPFTLSGLSEKVYTVLNSN